MNIMLTNVYVDDQREAQTFYTEVLGFETALDIPVDEDSFLTVVSPDDPDGTQLLLEPSSHPAVKPYRDALVEDGIPAASFTAESVEREHERLTEAGVTFVQVTAGDRDRSCRCL